MEQDLGPGHEEYLTSLGTHLGVPSDQQSAFQAKMQGTLEMLMTADRDVRFQQLRMLAREQGAGKSDSGVLALLKMLGVPTKYASQRRSSERFRDSSS